MRVQVYNDVQTVTIKSHHNIFVRYGNEGIHHKWVKLAGWLWVMVILTSEKPNHVELNYKLAR